MLKMDTFTETGQSTDNKNSNKFDFMCKKDFKRSVIFVDYTRLFLSTVYTLVNKLSSANVNEIYQGLFSKMKDEIRKSPIMKTILKIATNASYIQKPLILITLGRYFILHKHLPPVVILLVWKQEECP